MWTEELLHYSLKGPTVMPQKKGAEKIVKTKQNKHLSGRLDRDLGAITWGEDAEEDDSHSFQTLVGCRGSNEGERGLRRILNFKDLFKEQGITFLS